MAHAYHGCLPHAPKNSILDKIRTKYTQQKFQTSTKIRPNKPGPLQIRNLFRINLDLVVMTEMNKGVISGMVTSNTCQHQYTGEEDKQTDNKDNDPAP